MAKKLVYTFEVLKDGRYRTTEGKKDLKKGDTFEANEDVAKVLRKSYPKHVQFITIEEETKGVRKQADLGVTNTAAFDQIEVPEEDEEVLEEEDDTEEGETEEDKGEGNDEADGQQETEEDIKDTPEDATNEVEGEEGQPEETVVETIDAPETEEVVEVVEEEKPVVVEDELAKRSRLYKEAEELKIPGNTIPSNISTEKLEAKVEEAKTNKENEAKTAA